MASSMRRVRRDFRKEVSRYVTAGDGSIEKLTELAGAHFGKDVGYEILIKSFLGSEVRNALSCLREEGKVESVGKLWKLAGELSSSESTLVSTRRWKRLRGELQAEIDFANKHGLADEALRATGLLAMLRDAEVEHEEVHAQ